MASRLLKFILNVIMIGLLMVVLVACTTTEKLKELSYSEELITEFKNDKIDKTIVENDIMFEDYNEIINNKEYNKDNRALYLKLYNKYYSAEKIEIMLVGVNTLVNQGKTAEDFEFDNIKEILESALKPELRLEKNELTASLEKEASVEILNKIVAISKFDGDIKNNVVITGDIKLNGLGEYDVKLEATDSKGYSSELEETIKVIDDEIPVIEVESNNEYFKNEEIDLLSSVKAYDNFDGDITDKITVNSEGFSSSESGTYIVEYSVSDSSGNTTQKKSTITILNSVEFNEAFKLNKYTIKVNSCSYNRTDSEPADLFYQYYNAGENQTFLICKVQIKNEDDIQRTPFDIFGNDSEKLSARLIYDTSYKYDEVAHRLENNWYYTFMSLNPLTSSTKNLTFEVPIEVKDTNKSTILEFSNYKFTDESVFLKLK